MALQAEIIPFTIRTPAGAGTQTISHVRYPSIAAKAIRFICASNSGTNSEIYGEGFDDGTNRVSASIGMSELFGTSLSARGVSTTYSLITEQAQAFGGGYQLRLAGYVSAINVGSFDITLDLNNTPGAEWLAIVIGGDDVSCAVGVYAGGAGTGAVTLAFRPAAVFKLGCIASGTGESAGAEFHSGFAVPCNDNQVGWGISCNAGSSASSSYQIDGVVQQDITAGSTTLSDPVTISAWNVNGFDVTVSGSPLFKIGYLAVGGTAVSANLVAITQPTSTGLQQTTIDATDPVIAFFASTNKTATAGAGNVDANLSFGCYDGVSNVAQWWGTVNGAAFPYKRDRLSSTTKSVLLATATGASTAAENAQASCTFSSTKINLTWTAADATQREIWALVLASNLTGSYSACGVNPQGSITVLKQCTPIAGGDTEFPFGATGGLSPSSFTLLDGESQLFANVSPGTYGITESAPDGWTATYDVSNDDPHDAIVLSGTEAITVTVTNTFQSSETAQILRRLRRWALPWDGNKKIFIPRIEIIAQMGVGNSDDPDPVMSLRISPDGGETWGPYREMPLGASGDTMIRAYLTRFCQGLRNPVAELICDAPVFVAWVACELPQDFTVGTS